MIDASKYTKINRNLRPLSLAIKLNDNVALNGKTIGKTNSSLKKQHYTQTRKAIRNASGYHLYLALEDGNYTVNIESDYYMPKELNIELPDHGLFPQEKEISNDGEVEIVNLAPEPESLSPPEVRGPLSVQVALIPNTNYPIPSSSTLIYGEVINGNNEPVPDSRIIVEPQSQVSPPIGLQFYTNSKGQFVLYCNKLKKDDDFETESPPYSDGSGNAKKLFLLQINGKDYGGNGELKIRAIHDDYEEVEIEKDIKESEAINVKLALTKYSSPP